MSNTIGESFRKARDAKGVSLVEAGAATRIKTSTLEQIEANDFRRIPAPLYARGFIKMYAEYLGLDPAPLVASYNRVLAGESSSPTALDVAVLQRTPDEKRMADGLPRMPVVEPPVPGEGLRAPPVAKIGDLKPAPEPRKAESATAPFRLEGEVVPPPAAAPAARSAEPTAGRPAGGAPASKPVAKAAAKTESWGPSPLDAAQQGGTPWSWLLRYGPVGLGVLLVVVLVFSGLNRYGALRSKKGGAAPAVAPARVESAGSLRLAEDPPLPYLKAKR